MNRNRADRPDRAIDDAFIEKALGATLGSADRPRLSADFREQLLRRCATDEAHRQRLRQLRRRRKVLRSVAIGAGLGLFAGALWVASTVEWAQMPQVGRWVVASAVLFLTTTSLALAATWGLVRRGN